MRSYHMVTANPRPGEAYNIGGTFSCTVGDMLKHLLSLARGKRIGVEVEQARLRPIDADLQVPDTRKFRGHTGWQPKISFERAMQDLLDYWRERIGGGEVALAR